MLYRHRSTLLRSFSVPRASCALGGSVCLYVMELRSDRRLDGRETWQSVHDPDPCQQHRLLAVRLIYDLSFFLSDVQLVSLRSADQNESEVHRWFLPASDALLRCRRSCYTPPRSRSHRPGFETCRREAAYGGGQVERLSLRRSLTIDRLLLLRLFTMGDTSPVPQCTSPSPYMSASLLRRCF